MNEWTNEWMNRMNHLLMTVHFDMLYNFVSSIIHSYVVIDAWLWIWLFEYATLYAIITVMGHKQWVVDHRSDGSLGSGLLPLIHSIACSGRETVEVNTCNINVSHIYLWLYI